MAIVDFLMQPTAPIGYLYRTAGGGGATIYYTQKVYDTGTAGWCFYESATLTASPGPTETHPNYTGTISNHTIVGSRLVP